MKTYTCNRCGEDHLLGMTRHCKTFKCRAKARSAKPTEAVVSKKPITCKSCFNIIQQNHFDTHRHSYKCQFLNSMNPLERIVYFFPDKFDYQLLSKNPMVTIDLIEMFPEKDWDWKAISKNYDEVSRKKYPEKNWYDPHNPGKNISVDLGRIKPRKANFTILEPYQMEEGPLIEKTDMFYYKPDEVSSSPFLRVDWIFDTPHYPWNWTLISKNSFSK